MIDLHGLTVDGAERRLAGELTRLRAGGVREVRIVTGRGFGSHAGRPKLAPAVGTWLRSQATRERIGVVSVSPAKSGGAFDVRLGK